MKNNNEILNHPLYINKESIEKLLKILKSDGDISNFKATNDNIEIEIIETVIRKEYDFDKNDFKSDTNNKKLINVHDHNYIILSIKINETNYYYHKQNITIDEFKIFDKSPSLGKYKELINIVLDNIRANNFKNFKKSVYFKV